MSKVNFLLLFLLTAINNLKSQSTLCCPDPTNVTGPSTLYVGSTGTYCTNLGGVYNGRTILAYDWNVTGEVVIDGSDNNPCVNVRATGEGSFCVIVTLFVDEIGCIVKCLTGVCPPPPPCPVLHYVREDCPPITYHFWLEDPNGNLPPDITTVAWRGIDANSQCQPHGWSEWTPLGDGDGAPSVHVHYGGSNEPPDLPIGWNLICADITLSTGATCERCTCIYVEDCRAERGLQIIEKQVILDELVEEGELLVTGINGTLAFYAPLKNTKEVPLPTLEPGTYVCVLRNGKETIRKKFVVFE